MDNYINKYNKFDITFVYDFKLGDGGIGDYIKFFMIILTYCMNNNIRFYHKINNIEIEKYIKIKYDILNITQKDINKLTNVFIKTPYDYYQNVHYNYNMLLDEVFYFDNVIINNVKNILTTIPLNYISIHLRLGDKYLEVDKKYVLCKNDTREFSEEKIHNFIENNSSKNILFFCDNNNYKLNIKQKYKNIIITNSSIGHTSLSNTSNKQILDTITEFYILSNSELIFAGSNSGFSKMASKFKNVKYIN